VSDRTGGAQPAYTYAATVVRWVDGDTVDLDVDLGFHMRAKDRFRLYGINTPERGQEGYHQATAYMEERAPVGSTIIVRTYPETEKYGRWLAEIVVDGTVLNRAILGAELAVSYFGGTKT
jgi:micrococcal nuclease